MPPPRPQDHLQMDMTITTIKPALNLFWKRATLRKRAYYMIMTLIMYIEGTTVLPRDSIEVCCTSVTAYYWENVISCHNVAWQLTTKSHTDRGQLSVLGVAEIKKYKLNTVSSNNSTINQHHRTKVKLKSCCQILNHIYAIKREPAMNISLVSGLPVWCWLIGQACFPRSWFSPTTQFSLFTDICHWTQLNIQIFVKILFIYPIKMSTTCLVELFTVVCVWAMKWKTSFSPSLFWMASRMLSELHSMHGVVVQIWMKYFPTGWRRNMV